MKKLISIGTIVLVFACSTSKTFKAVTVNNETLQLKNDTLQSSNGSTFFVGQQLIVGNPAGDDGYFRSIIYKSAVVPSIWGQDMRYDHAIENHVSKKRSREGVKRLLVPGKTVTVKKIRLWQDSKPNFYYVLLASDSELFFCDIQFALSLKELVQPPA